MVYERLQVRSLGVVISILRHAHIHAVRINSYNTNILCLRVISYIEKSKTHPLLLANFCAAKCVCACSKTKNIGNKGCFVCG